MLSVADMILLGTLPALLVGSAFFSGSETALFGLSSHQQLQLRRAHTRASAAAVTLLTETRTLLITLLVANTAINVTYFVVSTVVLMRVQEHGGLHPGVMVALTVAPLLMLILLGEVLPKLVAARAGLVWARGCALPLMGIHRVLAPLHVVMDGLIIAPLARLIGPATRPSRLSPEEIETLLELSRHRGVIDPDEQQLLQEVITLGQLKVRDLMTPRVDIQAFDLARDPAQLVDLIRSNACHHLPVFEQDLDHIIGIVHARQVLLRQPDSVDQLRPLIKQPVFVPELQRADQLLVQFRKTGTTLAIAVDEYGGTAGLVTLEDVVEQMVGQIAGPDEPPTEPEVQLLHPGVWRVSADLSIRDWADTLGDEMIPAHDDQTGSKQPLAWLVKHASTLGGLVMARLGRLPTQGDRITLGNVQIEVQAMTGRRIQSLRVQVDTPDARSDQATHQSSKGDQRG